MQFTGEITKITPKIMVGKDNNLAKITICIRQMNVEKPYSIAVDVIGEQADQYEGVFHVGEIVKADIGSKYNARTDDKGVEKIFNTIKAWRITLIDPGQNGEEILRDNAKQPTTETQVMNANGKTNTVTTNAPVKQDDDLPF